jgi:hypothetical protein
MIAGGFRSDSGTFLAASSTVKSQETPNKDAFLTLLTMRRKQMNEGNRAKTKMPAPLPWLYPWAVERAYRDYIKGIMKQFIDITQKEIMPNLPAWLGENNDGIRTDVEEEEGETSTLREIASAFLIFAGLDRILFSGAGVRSTKLEIKRYGIRTEAFNSKEWKKQTKRILGVPYDITDPFIASAVEAWAMSNFELIRSMEQRYIKDLNQIVLNGVQRGSTSQAISRQIRALDRGLKGYQADRLARDQIGKLNGVLTRQRQQAVGITTYIWVTAGDERVRGNPAGPFKGAVPSHYVMSGEICRWDNPNVYWNGVKWVNRTGRMPKAHPGEEIQCRCTGLPNWSTLIEEADQQIQQVA